MEKHLAIISRIKELFTTSSSAELSHDQRSQQRHELVASFKARSDRNRTPLERFADNISGVFGSIWFIGLHVVWFAVWVPWNLGWIPELVPFDPFPFGLLTMIVSLEAIFLSSFVLLSQNRSAKVADLREDVDLNINVQTELEVTKLLNLVDDIHTHLGLRTQRDRELEQLKQRTNVEKIEATIVEETAAANSSDAVPHRVVGPKTKSKRSA